MNDAPDLAFFSLLARQPSLAAAAQIIGVTPPAVSRRLAALEKRLGVRLLNRTTRRLSLNGPCPKVVAHRAACCASMPVSASVAAIWRRLFPTSSRPGPMSRSSCSSPTVHSTSPNMPSISASASACRPTVAYSPARSPPIAACSAPHRTIWRNMASRSNRVTSSPTAAS